MDSTKLIEFFTEDGARLHAPAAYVLGARSRFLEECRTWAQTGSTTEDVTNLIDRLAFSPSMDTKQDLADHIPCDIAEVERLHAMVHGVLCCTGMALSFHSKIESITAEWLSKALECWGVQLRVPAITLQWNQAASQIADDIFNALIRLLPDNSQDHTGVLEMRDLLRYLLGAEPTRPTHNVEMRVLGVGKVNYQEEGFCPVLSLELHAEGMGFFRHPASLLLPCDSSFRQTLIDAQTFTARGFPWPLEGVQREQKWERGAVRWRLHDERLPAAAGNSIGGAIGAGLILLLTRQSGDNLAMTASIDANGWLGSVDAETIPLKVKAAKAAGLHTILVERNQGSDFRTLLGMAYTGQPFDLQPFATAVEAAWYIAGRSGIRGAYLTYVHAASSEFDLLSGKAAIGGENGLYVKMPLLHEIKREKLMAKDPRPGREGVGTEDWNAARDPWQGWEEFVMQEVTEHQEVALEQVFRSASHMVLIGSPGSGKSALCQYLVWRTSDKDDRLKVADKLIVPAWIRLREWERNQAAGHDDLPAYLASQFTYRNAPALDHVKPPTAELWSKWLAEGDVLLLLDGLDEVSQNFVNTIAATVRHYKDCLILVSCRTISRERLDTVFPDLKTRDQRTSRVYRAAPFREAQQKQYIRQYAHRSKGYDPEVLAAELKRPEIQLMATNPLLLSTICYVAAASGSTRLPATRTGLYEKAVTTILHQLMEGAPRQPVHYVAQVKVPTQDGGNVTELRAIEFSEVTKRHALENLAYMMFVSDERKIVFTESETKHALARALAGMESHGALSDTMLTDLRENSRLLTGRKGEDYSFLHPTYQEFLAACALARRAALVGFDGTEPGKSGAISEWEERESECKRRWREAFRHIDSAFKKANFDRERAEKDLTDLEKLIALLDHKAWLPEWQELFLFLAGKLNDPVPLLDLLSDAHDINRDDMFRHRLALAALCMAEIDPSLRNGNQEDSGQPL